MKTILSICLVMIVSLACSTTNQLNSNGGKNKPLIIEGSFISEKNITCTLYKLDEKGNFILQYSNKFKRDFTVHCEIGSNYIVQFTNSSGNTKLLLIEATVANEYVLDVDFSKEYNAVLKYRGHGYALSPIDKNESRILFVTNK